MVYIRATTSCYKDILNFMPIFAIDRANKNSNFGKFNAFLCMVKTLKLYVQ